MAGDCFFDSVVFTAEANFAGYDFSSCQLINVTFQGCPLQGAIFQGGTYYNIMFLSCDMTGANLSGSSFEQGLSFEGTILDYANLCGARYEGDPIPPWILGQAQSLHGAILPDCESIG